MQQIIDVHSHPLLKSFTGVLTDEETGGMPLPRWSPESHLEIMDRNGIAVCMLSVNNMEHAMAKLENQSLARRIDEAVRELVSAGRLLIGFDFPLMPFQTISPAIQSFAAYTGFSDEEKAKILSENARRLFPRLDVEAASRRS